jgi:hypothetical protein
MDKISLGKKFGMYYTLFLFVLNFKGRTPLITEQCLASSELLTPHPLSEDARHWIGLIQYNPSTEYTVQHITLAV